MAPPNDWAKQMLLNGGVNPLYGPQQPDPSAPAPPPDPQRGSIAASVAQAPQTPSQPTQPSPTPAPPPPAQPPTQPSAPPQRGAISDAMSQSTSAPSTPAVSQNAPIAGAPAEYKHGTLAKILLGVGEALGNPLATRIGQRDRERQQEIDEYNRPGNVAALQSQANLAQQKTVTAIDKDRYLAPRGGGVFDVTTGNYAPGTEPAEKPGTPEQQFIDSETKKGVPLERAIADYAKASHAPTEKTGSPESQTFEDLIKSGMPPIDAYHKLHPEHPPTEPGSWQMGVDGQGNPVLYNSKTAQVKPAPDGVRKALPKPSPDEQRRADLATNLNENFDQLEDIVNRRPELFGPLAGRWTELKGKFGSDDPDIAALSTLEHQIGMAQISAHGMRSSHGIEGASQSIVNGFHSGPNAIKAAIKAARSSVQTFQNDVDQAKGQAPAQSSPQAKQQPPASQTATGPNGHKIKVVGGKWVDAATGQPIQ